VVRDGWRRSEQQKRNPEADLPGNGQ
jgi:hypothetical protein